MHKKSLSAALLGVMTLLAAPGVAQATSPACEPPTLVTTAAIREPLPTDGRILVRPQGCYSPDKGTLTLRKVNGTTDVPVDFVHIATRSSFNWFSVKPRQDLEANAAYVITMHTPNAADVGLELTTAKDHAK